MYTLILKERILPDYANTVSWDEPTASPEKRAIHQSHLDNGDIISSTCVVDINNRLERATIIKYKSKEIADMIFAEQGVAAGFGRIEGVEVFSTEGMETL